MTGLTVITMGLCLGACADDEPSDEADALIITDAPPRFAVALGGTPVWPGLRAGPSPSA